MKIINKLNYWLNSSKFKPVARYFKEKNNIRHLNSRYNFYKKFLEKDDLVFDIGANIGNRTEIFLKLGCRVIAIEPQEECILQMKDKFKNNPNVILVNKAVDKVVHEKEILLCNVNSVSSMSKEWISKVKEGRYKGFKWKESRNVPTTTLNECIRDYGLPKFCKIDVEGYEKNALNGLSRPIKYISLEFNPELLENSLEIISYLSSLGYVLFNFSKKESMKLSFDDWVDDNKIRSHLENIGTWGDIYAKF
ncbi:FkbM family methyltransferase [Nanoarchaeota archaeon]